MATLLGLALLLSTSVAANEGSSVDEGALTPALESVWNQLAECESTQRWQLNTGNGYFGGLQEDLVFWRNYGGPSYASRPDLASREQQIRVARVGLDVQGWSAWPVCSRRLGLDS